MRSSNLKIKELLDLLAEGESMGLDLRELIEKLNYVIGTNSNETIKIVLMGSFSDGKTSTIAGLLGKLQDSMKIDIAESSDELSVYRLEGLENGYEIIDTPGLFGTKEREIDGKNIKYSQITEKYISEAHLLLYVCDAVVPLKESHKESLKLVLRDFNKLLSTVFIINKMDEAGVDMLDDEEYNESAAIKIDNLKGRLRTTINLTSGEERELKIVCIAADPKQKGMGYWLQSENITNYKQRSHIELVRDKMNMVINQTNRDQLIADADLAVLKDVTIQTIKEIKRSEDLANAPLEQSRNLNKEMKRDLHLLEEELRDSRNTMHTSLKNLRESLIKEVNTISSLENFGQFVELNIGVDSNGLSCSVLGGEIDRIINECAETNNSMLKTATLDFAQKNKLIGQYGAEALKCASKWLKGVKIDNKMVLKGRDLVFKSHKFKPWGATKMAGKINVGAKVGGVALYALAEAYDFYQKWKESKKLSSAKQDIKNLMSEIFSDIENSIKGENYFENYAPSYLEMKNRVAEQENYIIELQNQNDNISDFRAKLSDFLKIDSVDAEYEEI